MHRHLKKPFHLSNYGMPAATSVLLQMPAGALGQVAVKAGNHCGLWHGMRILKQRKLAVITPSPGTVPMEDSGYCGQQVCRQVAFVQRTTAVVESSRCYGLRCRGQWPLGAWMWLLTPAARFCNKWNMNTGILEGNNVIHISYFSILYKLLKCCSLFFSITRLLSNHHSN